MSNARAWLFRVLIIIAAGLMVYSWISPWWASTAEAASLDPIAKIFPTGMWFDYQSIGYTYMVEGMDMPAWFAPAMWVYLGLCLLALLYSLFAKAKEIKLGKINLTLPQFLIGLVGISYIVVAVIAIIVITIRTGEFMGGVPVRGCFTVDLGLAQAIACQDLQFGYWLACGVGPLLIVLALLRNRITGKPTLNVR